MGLYEEAVFVPDSAGVERGRRLVAGVLWLDEHHLAGVCADLLGGPARRRLLRERVQFGIH